MSNPVSKAEPDSSLNIGGVKLATDTSTKLRVAELPNCNMISARLLHARSWWLGLGWYSYQSTSIHIVQKQPKEAINSKDKVIIDQKFIPRFRLFANGLWIQSTRIHGNWQYTFRPIRIIPRTAPIFEACRNGDLEQVIYLFRDGSVTIFDTTQSGWTLLHVSVLFQKVFYFVECVSSPRVSRLPMSLISCKVPVLPEARRMSLIVSNRNLQNFHDRLCAGG